MTEFELPYPTELTDDEAKQVYVALNVLAEAYRTTVVDEPTKYLAALSAALVRFMKERLDARSVAGAFDDITPEDFGDPG